MKRLRYLVGLTGGIASGKSLVAKLFEEHGATVIDADRIVAECYRSNLLLKAELLFSFGPGIFSWPFAVDKQKLAGRVFPDRKKLSKLEEIVWPYVFDKIEDRIDESEGIIIVEASRLFESGYGRCLHEVITVESLPEVQRYRLMRYRGFSREKADEIVELQRQDMVRWPFTEYTIYNPMDDPDSRHGNLRRQVGNVWERLVARSLVKYG